MRAPPCQSRWVFGYYWHDCAHQRSPVGTALASPTPCLLTVGGGGGQWNRQSLDYPPRWAGSVLKSFVVNQPHILLQVPDLTNLKAGIAVNESSAAWVPIVMSPFWQTVSHHGSASPHRVSESRPAISQRSHNSTVIQYLLSPSVLFHSPKLSTQWKENCPWKFGPSY